jgi:hypothetical protein
LKSNLEFYTKDWILDNNFSQAATSFRNFFGSLRFFSGILEYFKSFGIYISRKFSEVVGIFRSFNKLSGVFINYLELLRFFKKFLGIYSSF